MPRTGNLPILSFGFLLACNPPGASRAERLTSGDSIAIEAVQAAYVKAQLAFSRGLSKVAWRYEKDTVRSEQSSRTTSLTIFGRRDDGRWKILRQMWGPPLR